MAEYKDVEPLKKQIADLKCAVSAVSPVSAVKSLNSDYMTGYISALSAIEGAIAEQSSADVVEVVRYKDCKYYERNGCYHPNYDDICEKLMPKEPDDYCNYGERT